APDRRGTGLYSGTAHSGTGHSGTAHSGTGHSGTSAPPAGASWHDSATHLETAPLQPLPGDGGGTAQHDDTAQPGDTAQSDATETMPLDDHLPPRRDAEGPRQPPLD